MQYQKKSPKLIEPRRNPKGPPITLVNLTAHVGRNKPCPSGNGKKFKRSHGGPRPGACVAARFAGEKHEMPALFSYTESNPPPARPVGVR